PSYSAGLRANASQDLSIGWLAPYDDNLFGGTTGYRVFRATSPQGPWTLDVSGPIPANGSASYRFIDVGRAADTTNYYYRIETIDAAGHTTLSSSIAVKFRLSFAAGLNLLGMPLLLTQPTFGATGATRVMGFDPAGSYHVRDLNATDAVVGWTGYWIFVPRAVDWTVAGW